MKARQNSILQPAHGPGDEQADGCPSDDIQGIMDPDINPGIRHDGRNAEKQGGQPAERLRQEIGRRKDVHRMGRGERVRGIAVGQETESLKNLAGANSAYPFLEKAAGEGVGDGQGEAYEHQENQSRPSFPPQKVASQDRKDICKILQISHERHEPIEERILPRLVDKMEKGFIQGVYPGSHAPPSKRALLKKYLLKA